MKKNDVPPTCEGTFTITLLPHNTLSKKRVYGQSYRAFHVLSNRQATTISTRENPSAPLLFDGKNIICFSSSLEAKQFIDFLMTLRRPTFFQRIASTFRLALFSRKSIRV